MNIALEIMSTNVITVKPDTSIQELLRLFAKEQVSGFPVVEEDGSLVGVVTESDVIHGNQRIHEPKVIALFDAVFVFGEDETEEDLQRMAASKVEEIMTPSPVTVDANATLTDMATIMSERHVHTLPVLDEDGKVIGVVGKRDLIKALAK